MAGWSTTVSGGSADPQVHEGIRARLEQLWAHEVHGTLAHGFRATDTGWEAHASGDAETPGQHQALADGVRAATADPAALTGHSSFSSPYVQLSNFHQVPPAGSDAAAQTPGAL